MNTPPETQHQQGPNMESILERFLRLSVADGDARPRTVQAYRDALRFFGAWCRASGVDPVSAINEDVLNYRKMLISRFKRNTIRLRLTAVRLLYRAMTRWGGRRDNPAEGVRAPKEKEGAASSVLNRAVSPDQAKALLAAATAGRDGAMIRLMLLHGLRAGEISRVNAADLSPDGARLSVPGKGGKRRTLVLSYRCRQDLSGAPPGPLFPRRGRRGSISVRSIERVVNKALTAVGAKEPGKSAHSLRHGFGVLSAMGGARPEAISEAMGHADLKTTGVYTRAAWQYMENPTDAVERALKGEIR